MSDHFETLCIKGLRVLNIPLSMNKASSPNFASNIKRIQANQLTTILSEIIRKSFSVALI